MMKKSNKIIIVVICSVIAVAIAVIAGVLIYKNNRANELNAKADFYQNKIAICYRTFTDGSEDKKTNSLSEMSKIFENYKKEKDFQEINSTRNVSKEFNDKIDSMKNYFVSENEKKINDIDVDSIISSNSKDSINSAIKELSNICNTIKTETSIYTIQQIDEINSEINKKVSKLKDKIKSIDEADKKAREKKAREEKAKKEKAEASNNVNSGSSKTSGSSKSGTSGNTSKTGGSTSPKKYNADGTINPKVFFGNHAWATFKTDGCDMVYIDDTTHQTYDVRGNLLGSAGEWGP